MTHHIGVLSAASRPGVSYGGGKPGVFQACLPQGTGLGLEGTPMAALILSRYEERPEGLLAGA